MPGWYSPDDTTGESGLHSSKDMRVSDRALNELKEKGLFGPQDIRKIRTNKLCLSQKDEDGVVLISRGINTALRLLANDSSRLNEISESQNHVLQE